VRGVKYTCERLRVGDRFGFEAPRAAPAAMVLTAAFLTLPVVHQLHFFRVPEWDTVSCRAQPAISR
jgi:hypothetical protein